jgi:hypothetical protein
LPHKDPEKRKQYLREYRQKNKERINKYNKERYKNNLAYRLSRCFNLGYPIIPIKTRRELIKRANAKCEVNWNNLTCAGSLGIHHIDENPKNNELKNLQLLCQRHHQQLHNALDKNPSWKGDKASNHAKYMRKYRRRKNDKTK